MTTFIYFCWFFLLDKLCCRYFVEFYVMKVAHLLQKWRQSKTKKLLVPRLRNVKMLIFSAIFEKSQSRSTSNFVSKHNPNFICLPFFCLLSDIDDKPLKFQLRFLVIIWQSVWNHKYRKQKPRNGFENLTKKCFAL